MAKNQKMSKIQQIDFLLMRKMESISLPKHIPIMLTNAGDQMPHNGTISNYRDYWFHRGRREAFAEIRVMLKTEMGS